QQTRLTSPRNDGARRRAPSSLMKGPGSCSVANALARARSMPVAAQLGPPGRLRPAYLGVAPPAEPKPGRMLGTSGEPGPRQVERATPPSCTSPSPLPCAAEVDCNPSRAQGDCKRFAAGTENLLGGVVSPAENEKRSAVDR